MELEVDGRTHVVHVRRSGTSVVVAVDGVEMAVDAVKSGSGWSLLLGNAPPPGDVLAPGYAAAAPARRLEARRSYDVTVDRRGPGELEVLVDGVVVRVGVPARRARRGGGGQSDAGPQTVLAPMPGRVVKVLVGVGDAVQAGQPVVVVEAMKMENELRVARAGTVAEVRAMEGMLVEARAVLLVVNSPEAVDSAEEVLPQES
jgi:biotin carboxyl carrier protein